MRTIPPEAGFFLLLVAGVLALVLLSFPSLYGSFCLLLALLPGIVLYLTRSWPDRAFYLTCAGQPAVIACGSATVFAGLFVALMLAGMAGATMGLFSRRGDYGYLVLFFCLTLVPALLVQVSSHVFLLLVALGAGLALLFLVMTVRDYQFRKECAGAPP